MSFRPPVRDIVFSLRHVAGFDAVAKVVPEADFETVEAVLDAAGEFAGDVIAPLNTPGDKAGVTLTETGVKPAPGFGDAYGAFWQGGWNSLSADPVFGGQGLPETLEVAVFEMVQSACLAFGLCPMLTQGVIEALTAHGSQAQQALYLPKLVSGEWTGTMNLTEPQAGSDLGAITTRAEPDGEGGWRLTGQKIFITWGDQDFTDNIVHLVLARTPGAPAGVKGISLFLCPKRLVDERGAVGDANAVRPVGVEHKLGIHASPTCVMAFEGAKAEMVGVEGQGLAHMFTMMNAARLAVGAQGVAVAERAYQQALAYAAERRQGKSVWTGEASAPIFDHPDVRRTLMLVKAHIEAARGICLSTAVATDLARHAATDEARAAAKAREELLTPIAKGWSTDMAVWAASQCLQLHGGMGFIEETGAAQHYRDARILPIYEGTNGIQALDLIGRKLADGGAAMRALIADVRQGAASLTGDLAPVGQRLALGADALEAATGWLLERRGTPDAAAGASLYLRLAGDVVGGLMLARGAAADPDGVRSALARLFAGQVLSAASGLADAVMQGADDLQDASVDVLASA
jgi:alkylation response protein AidB-like acyl-CoA dehydrogenase